jgi:hypothetical protein
MQVRRSSMGFDQSGNGQFIGAAMGKSQPHSSSDKQHSYLLQKKFFCNKPAKSWGVDQVESLSLVRKKRASLHSHSLDYPFCLIQRKTTLRDECQGKIHQSPQPANAPLFFHLY